MREVRHEGGGGGGNRLDNLVRIVEIEGLYRSLVSGDCDTPDKDGNGEILVKIRVLGNTT